MSKDPLHLWQRILATHEFGIESMVEEEVAGAARDAYYAHMRQKSNEDITSYKKRFDIAVLGLRSTFG